MCGASATLTNLANSATAFAGQVQQQASQIFGSASTVFNNLVGTIQNVVKGGPGQAGWGATEAAAVNSQIINNAAANARNEKSAVGNSIAAIGGGNTVSPSGLEVGANLNVAQNVENAKSQQEEQATVANFQQGNQNYTNAVNQEMQLPSVFNASAAADNAAVGANTAATTAQTAVSSANNWWEPLVGAGIGAAGKMGAAYLGAPSPSPSTSNG